MTSVEKRRSGRKSGGHRKHSDGGYSDTSSGGSFLDETDREVSNLTDRAFRSLCIGDEAVYNDSDLCSSSPCFQRDRQLAFGQSGLARDREDREELKRAAHESFSLRVQHYGQDWLQEGMFGADVHRDPQWEVYGQNTQGRISATFQHSFMETSQQEKSLREEHLSFLSNGATELSLQQRRSRSRVSSLIRAFNSEGQRDGSGTDNKLREWNDETSWDKSALMSIQRELSEFSYQQNFNNGHFPSAGPFSSRDSSCYSSEVAAVTHHHSDASFMRSSHCAQSLSAQVNCNSNFFIHSEYSPFKLWRDHNRFPFKQGEVSGFMPRSEFPKWYETPMYKELSLETDPRGRYRFAEREVNHPRNNLANVIHPSPPRSTSTSTVLQKTLAVEKRCESELTSHNPHRKRVQSLGNNRLPSLRPSTASPTTEMSQRVRDTIRSAEALRQKIQMITEQNMATGFAANQQEVICSNDRLVPFGNASVAEPPNVSPQPVEHPPVRAESRGATPDARMSSYKSRATSLLFNLKDNRKRVKSTYSPAKFKGLDAQEKHKQLVQEPRDIVIDIPDFPDSDIQFPNIEEASRTNAAFHQHVNQYHSTASSRTTLNSQPATAYTGHNLDYTLNNHQAAQTQGEMVHHPGFADFISKNDTSYQLVNGQNLQDSLSFAPYNQAMIDHPTHKTSYIKKLNTGNNQIRDYSISEANTEQCFNEKVGREFTKVEGYQHLKDNKHDYSNVSLQDRWRPLNSQDTEKLNLKADTSPWKQEITTLLERDQYAQTSQRAPAIKEERNLSRDTYRRENQQSLNKELKKTELGESFGVASSHQTNALDNSNKANQQPQYASFSNNVEEREASYGQQPRGASTDKNVLKTHYRNTEDTEIKEKDLTQSLKRHNPYSHRDTTILTQETAQRNQSKHPLEMPKMQESLQSREPKLQLQHHLQNNLWSNPDRASVPTLTNQVKEQGTVEVKAVEYIKGQHAQAQLAKAQPLAQVESARLILAGHTSSEKVRAEKANAELPKNERIEQSTAEQIKEQKVEDKGKVTERQSEPARVRRVTEEPRITTKEAGAVHLKEDEGEQVKAEQVKVEKTELVKRETEQAREQQTVLRDKIKAKQADQEEVRAEQVEREQKEVEQMKTEKVKAATDKAEHAKQDQMDEQQTKAKEQKVKVVEKEKKNKDSTDVGQANAQQPTTQTSKVKEAVVENKTREQAKLLEKWTAPAAKLTMTQHVKIEPDKVEQVKSELAKAKAELAKIKEKMRGEQKEKDRNIISTKEDNVKIRDVSLGLNSNKTNDYSVKDKTTQGNQQRDNKIVRGADDYERLREKYGFTNAVSTNINTVSTVGNHLLHNAKETSALSLDEVETMNTEKPKPQHSPTARIENIGVTDSHYVYSESSKEFKLTSAVDTRANSNTVADTIMDHSDDKSEKCESAKQTDPQQRDADLNKHPTLERKPKSAEQCLAPSKDSRYTPLRALSHKEKVQTKQEILTSRIKAHAEKEISAIKEKGLAMRDGFIGKNSTKQVAAGQSIRQRPAPHDVSKKQGSTVSSNITPQHQMEPLGIQMAPAEAVLPLSPAVTPVTSASSTSQLVDHSQKQAPKEPKKAQTDFVLEPYEETKQMQICPMSLSETQKKEKQGTNPEENCGKPKEQLKDNPVINTSYLNKNKENPQKEENKQEAGLGDSAPSLNLSFGQNEGPVADDNLQIMGIRVTVRERKTSLKETPVDNSTQEQMKAKGSKCYDSDLNNSHPSLNSEVCKEKSSSAEMGTAKTKDSIIQEANFTAKKDPTNVAMNMQETKEFLMLRENNEISNTEGNNHKACTESVTKQNVQLPVKEDTVIKPFGNGDTDGESGPPLEQKILDSPATKQLNSPSIGLTQNENTYVSPKLQYTKTNIEEKTEVDNEVHIDSIAIRVVPAVTDKHNLKIAPASTDVANEHKQEKAITSKVEDKTERLTPTNTTKAMQDSLEDKSGVQYVLSDVGKLSESQKTSMNTISVKNQTKEENSEKVKKSVNDFEIIEGDYFQVQGLKDANNSKDDIPDGALKTKNKNSTSSDLHKGETDVLCQSDTVQSSSVSVKNTTIKRKNPETDHQLDSKQNEGPTEEQSNKQILEVGQANHIRKHHTDGQSILTTREKERSRHSHSPKECEAKQRPEVKPKQRTSTIPEISAIADYARLKVIVSEDHAHTVQDVEPNRKEGFFPLIQTRHSRRPVSTADSKDVFEKDNSFPNKMEVNAKVNKEPKALVFPITEKEHQRTGMFKLGDKERPDKLPIVKSNEKHLTEIKSTTARTEHVDEPGTQRSSKRGQSIPQATRNTNDGLTYLNKSSASRTTLAEEENKRAIEREAMAIEIQEKREKNRQAGKMREEETNVKQNQEERTALQLTARQCEEGRRRKEDEEKSRTNIIEETKTKLKVHQEQIKEDDKEQQRRATQEEQQTKAVQKEQQRRTAQEQQRKAVQEEQQRRAAQEEQQKRATQEEQQRRAIQEEQQRRAAQEQQRRALREEQQRRAAQEEQRAKAIQEEQQRKAAQEEQQRAAKEEQQRKTAQEEQQRRALQEEQQRRAVQDEQQRRAMQEEQQRRAAQEQQRRALQEEQQRRAAQEEQRAKAIQEEQQRRAAQEEQRRALQEEQQRRAAQEEQRAKAIQEEQQRKAAQEEQQRAAKEEQQRKSAQEEQQRRALQEEQQRRAAQEEQLRRAAQEEQQRRALQEEQQRKAAQEEQQRKAAQEERQRKAAQEEQQRRAAQEEQQRKAAQEEQQRKAVQEEQQRAAKEEQQRRTAQEEEQRKAAQEEQQRRVAKKEQQRRAAQEEQQRKAAQEEQQRKAVQEEQQRAAKEEQQRRTAQEEEQRKAAQEEQQRRVAKKEQQRRAAQEEQQRKAAQEEQQRKAVQEEQQRAAKEEQQRRTAQEEEQRKAAQEEQQRKAVQEEQRRRALQEEQQRKAAQDKQMQARRIEEKIYVDNEEQKKLKQREEEGKAEKEKTVIQQREDTGPEMEEEKRASQRMDALQYYAITSTEAEQKPRERQQRNNLSGLEVPEDPGSHSRLHRPQAPASPASSLPRSNTSSPALGAKPSMFRVKDNTSRVSSLTKSVKPRFHKSFGEDFRVGSPMERGEEEQDINRRSAVTPANLDTGSNRLGTIREASTFTPSKDYSAPHRPYSRRSLALDEDDSRSVISNMSEGAESFASCATDVANIRGLHDYERPESACSFSSDVSRSLGKPPTVPPKSEKALQRAKRLTSRRIKKELSKAAADLTCGVEKPPQEVSSSTEASSPHAVASAHFSSPVSLAHAPALESSLPSSLSAHGSPHTTGPISLPAALPHATAPVSLTATPKTVAHIASSPTLHHANQPVPVAKYHVEPNYPQSYPLTQRKVLQDLGSGQYYVVDVPVQVKTKTFFDPETGNYVQLNVRESGQSSSRPRPQQTYPQPHLLPQVELNPQQPVSQASPAGKPLLLYQGYHGYPPNCQPISSMPPHRSVSLHQDQQPARENHSCACPAPEGVQTSEGHRYSPEKTPYMDTASDTEKTHNAVNTTAGLYESFPERDTNSQLAGSSVCVNNNSARSRYQPCDIITMGELEDFMDVSDW